MTISNVSRNIARFMMKVMGAFVATLTLVLLTSTVTSAFSGPAPEEVRRNLEFVPIADSDGKPLRDEKGRIVVLDQGALNAATTKAYDALASAQRQRHTAEGRREYSEAVASIFGDSIDTDGSIRSSIGVETVDGREVARTLHGERWLGKPTSSKIDPRRYLEYVTDEEFEAILKENRRAGATE